MPFEHMPKQAKKAINRELAGIIYLSVSILLACSLVSYDWHDISFLHTSREAQVSNSNWVGVFGAYLGWVCYFLIGWSANLLPLIALFLGFSALFRSDYRLRPSSLWMLAFLLSATGLIQILAWGDAAWRHKNNDFHGIGGIWGTTWGG